jgi:16S rRNA (guanine966-N2)-methyltransferase
MVDGGWLRDGAIAVLEERTDLDIALAPPFERIDARSYGDTQILIARKSA